MKKERVMNRRAFNRFMLGASVFGFGTGRRSRAADIEPGYEPLFDGRTLEGWHVNPQRIGHGSGGRWRVGEGAIIGEQDPPGSGNGGLLLSDRKFADFDLMLEARPDWGPCSGVFFRCTEAGEGFQMYVDYHDGGNVGHLRGEMKGAFALMPFKIYGQLDEAGNLLGFETKVDPRAEKWPAGVYRSICTMGAWRNAWRVNDWNTIRLRCVGRFPKVQTWINGVLICDFDGASCSLPGYNRERVFSRLGERGSIGLQVHGGKGWPKGAVCRWRNIRIREL